MGAALPDATAVPGATFNAGAHLRASRSVNPRHRRGRRRRAPGGGRPRSAAVRAAAHMRRGPKGLFSTNLGSALGRAPVRLTPVEDCLCQIATVPLSGASCWCASTAIVRSLTGAASPTPAGDASGLASADAIRSAPRHSGACARRALVGGADGRTTRRMAPPQPAGTGETFGWSMPGYLIATPQGSSPTGTSESLRNVATSITDTELDRPLAT